MSKNTRNRILLTALAALLLVTLTIGGTMAWLVDKTTEVKNTFTTSNVDITLTEEAGKTEYKFKMVPNATITKDPKVTVIKGSETCWLFVKIDESSNLDSYIKYDVITVKNDTDNKYSYHWNELKDGVYYMEVAASDTNTSFQVLMNDQVTVNSGLTNADMDKAEGTQNPTLTFTAYAIQKSYGDVNAAWEEVSKLTDSGDHYTTTSEQKEGTTV